MAALVFQSFLSVVIGYNLRVTTQEMYRVPFYTRATSVFSGDLVVFRGMEEQEARAILQYGIGAACPAKFCYASYPQLGKGTYTTESRDSGNFYASLKDNYVGKTRVNGQRGVLMKFTVDRHILSTLSLIDATAIEKKIVLEKTQRFTELIDSIANRHETGKINSIDEILSYENRPKADLIYQRGIRGTQNQLVFRTVKACNAIRFEILDRRPIRSPLSFKTKPFGCSIM